MDCIVAASDLKSLLVSHSSAEKQVSLLGKLYWIFFSYNTYCFQNRVDPGQLAFVAI